MPSVPSTSSIKEVMRSPSVSGVPLHGHGHVCDSWWFTSGIFMQTQWDKEALKNPPSGSPVSISGYPHYYIPQATSRGPQEGEEKERKEEKGERRDGRKGREGMEEGRKGSKRKRERGGGGRKVGKEGGRWLPSPSKHSQIGWEIVQVQGVCLACSQPWFNPCHCTC